MNNSKLLIDRIVEMRNLRRAWYAVTARKSMTARGSDGQTIAEFASRREEYLASVRDQIRGGTFKFRPLVRHQIEKTDGGFRELRIPTIRDRVVLRAIHQRLNTHRGLKPVFQNESSFAYRPGVPMKRMVDKIVTLRKQYNWVMTADIIQFFDRIDPAFAIIRLEEMTGDSSINHLVWDALTVETVDSDSLPSEHGFDEEFDEDETTGLPQGLAISPVLSNVVLLDFDRSSRQRGFRIIRYADDIIAFCRSRDDAYRAHKHCTNLLEQLDLEIRSLESKTKEKSSLITKIDSGFSFVGLDYHGSVIRPSEDKLKKFEERIEEILSEQAKNGASSIYRQIHSYTDGWFGPYGPFCDSAVLRVAAERADRIVLDWMHGKFKTFGMATGTGRFKKGRARFLSPRISQTARRQSRRGSRRTVAS